MKQKYENEVEISEKISRFFRLVQ